MPVGRPPEISGEELTEVIHQECKLNDAPVVPTKWIAQAEGVPIERQAVLNRLENLHEEGRVGKIEIGGQGKVWWVPEDEAVDVDFSKLNWENLDIEEIPFEALQEHPEVQEPTFWESWEQKAGSIFEFVMVALVAGILTYATRNTDIPLLSSGQESLVETLGALALVAGIMFGVLGIAIVLISKIGQILVDHGAHEVLSVGWLRFRKWLSSSTGYRIEKVSEDTDD